MVIDTYGNVPANRKLYFLPACTTATWTRTHRCIGELYAPVTDFTFGGSAQLFGRITAKSINVSTSGGPHYDESLPPIGQDGHDRVDSARPVGANVRESLRMQK